MKHKITLIYGDGIGPEVIEASRRVIDASGVDIEWEKMEIGMGAIEKYGTPLPDIALESIRRNKVAFKGPVTTPVGKGFRSVNVAIRKTLDLYANVRPVKTYEGIPSKYSNIDLIIVRENTEDLYAGIEHMVTPDIAESIKIISKKCSDRIAKYAFEYAINNNRHKVTAVHKANIMKLSDGLFLRCVGNIAKEYKSIEFEDVIVDAMSMKLVMMPEDYDVLVLPNLYGDILSDLAAGLVGGLGIIPGANIGKDVAVFEAAHGSAPQIAGMNIANPIATMLSGVLMLRHIKEFDCADKIENAITRLIKEGKTLTDDLGGKAKTSEFADAVIQELNK